MERAIRGRVCKLREGLYREMEATIDGINDKVGLGVFSCRYVKFWSCPWSGEEEREGGSRAAKGLGIVAAHLQLEEEKGNTG